MINEDDDIVIASTSVSNKNCADTVLLNGQPSTQMDDGAKCTVTNLLNLLRNIWYFDDKFRCHVRMRGAT